MDYRRRRMLQRWGPLPAMRHRPEDAVEYEVADLVAERLPGILVIAEVLARVDTARCRLIRGLGEALEAPHDARKAGVRQGEVQGVGAQEIARGGGGPVADPGMRARGAPGRRRSPQAGPVEVARRVP